jgi:hypothetical protein
MFDFGLNFWLIVYKKNKYFLKKEIVVGLINGGNIIKVGIKL